MLNFAEIGQIPEWDCDVCKQPKKMSDQLYACPTFDKCGFCACADCADLTQMSGAAGAAAAFGAAAPAPAISAASRWKKVRRCCCAVSYCFLPVLCTVLYCFTLFFGAKTAELDRPAPWQPRPRPRQVVSSRPSPPSAPAPSSRNGIAKNVEKASRLSHQITLRCVLKCGFSAFCWRFQWGFRSKSDRSGTV